MGTKRRVALDGRQAVAQPGDLRRATRGVPGPRCRIEVSSHVTQQLVRSDHALWRRVGSSVVILRPGDPPFRIAGSGGAIWDLLGTPISRDDIVAALVAEFDAPNDVVAADVLPLLDDLLVRGAVEEVGPS